MIINQQNLDALFIAWNGIFQKSVSNIYKGTADVVVSPWLA
jgi:hypothetical protein